MGLFTGVGDFFRGVLGEDDEEKKRRKQREAQEAAARRQQAQTRPQNNPVSQPKVTNVNQLFGNKNNNNPVDPLGITGVQAPKPLFQQTQGQSKAPVAPKPAPQPKAPLPDQQFTGISEGEGKNKTIFGWNAAALLPKDYEKKYEVKADRTVTTNKDKYVAQFDKLHPDYQKVLVNAAKEKAKNGDQAAINTLQALKDTGRLEGNVMDFIEGSNERFLGGIGRGLLRTTDFVLPGKNTFGLEQLADEQDASKNGTRQFTDAGRAGETTGTVQKGIFDVSSMVIPGSALDKTMKGAKLVQTLENGTKIMKVGGTLVRVVPGSLMGTGIDYVQSIGRGDRPDLAESAATGLGIDLALEALPGASKYGAKGIRKLFGKKAGNIVEGIMKETDPTIIKNMLGIEGDVANEVISKLATETNPEVVKETLQKLSIDPSFKLDPDVQKRLEEEGIVAVKRDPNDPYGASYQDNTITARNQAALDQNVYHEMAHAQWQNKLTPEEKALFKGDGAASQSAKGRAGYTAEDINSEDFSDYMNKAMTGRFNEVPQELRTVIAKYARIALDDPNAVSSAVRSIAEAQKGELDNFLAANPNLTQEQVQSAINLSKQRAMKLINQTEASKANSIAALDEQVAKNTQQTTQLANQVAEAQVKAATATDPLASLKQEALKYGSADELPAGDKYSIANSDISRTRSIGMNEDGFTVEDFGGKKRFVSLDDATPQTRTKVRKAEAEYEAAKVRHDGSALAAKQKVNDAYHDAIIDLKLHDYATTEGGGRTFNSKYNDWLEQKYKDTRVDTATIKDMATNPNKYRKQFEQETTDLYKQAHAETSLKQQLTSPEIAANDPYRAFNQAAGIADESQDIDYVTAQQALERMAGNKTMDDLVQRQGFRIPTAINENTQGAVADALTDVTGKVTGKLLTSQNPVLNFMGQALHSLNNKSTLNNTEKSLVEQVKGRTGGIGNLRQQIVTSAEQPLQGLDGTGQALAKEKVFKAFEEFNNGNTDGSLAIIKSFTPEERAYFDNVRDMNVLRNNLNRDTMSPETIAAYANGMHMPRIYDMEAFAREFSPDDLEAFIQSQGRQLDLNPAKRRKQIGEIAQELQQQMLRDPAQASAIRTEIALHNKAVSEYLATVGAIPDAVSDVPLRGYLPIPNSPRYGEAAGKFIRRNLAEPILTGNNRFGSETYKAVNTLLDKYQGSILGKLEQGLRKGLTIYNPATRLGNRGANLAMGAMNGFNLPEMAVSQQHFINVLKNGGDEWTRLAKTFGAIDNSDALAKFSGAMTDPTGFASGVRGRLTQSYQDVDTATKVAMFKWQIQRGASPEDAARFVNRALPNIGNSGEIYSFFSRLPVLGTPFRAIQPEVLRALGSTMGRNTVPFLIAMATYTTLQNATWKDVPPEERQQIQERFGSGQTPFKGINDFFGSKGIPTDKVLPSSWSFNAAGVPGLQDLFATDPETGQRPVVDVDPRRLMGMYSINLGGDSAADSAIDTLTKASPVNIPVGYNNGEWSFQPQNVVSSRVFSPIWQTAIDKDFRGKSVQSPDRDGVNVVDPVTGQPLDKRDDPGRAAQYLLRSYIPQVNDVANVVDASQGKENFYGQDMNLPQSIARLFGLKGEQFDNARINDMNETERYFADKEQIDKQLADMTPTEQAAWKRLTGYDKLDQKKDNQFGGKSWVKAPVYNFGEDKWKDYAANPRLYDLMVQKKVQDSQRDGSPLQPEFDGRLSDGFRRQLIQNKMVAPGDDAELDQRMYASPEWDYYQKLKDEYKAAAKKYYGGDDENFSDELVKHQDAKFPSKPEAYAAYTAAYAQYAAGKAAKPEFTDAVKAAKDAYNMETLKWTNTERQARGLPPITWDVWNNPTFGFDETPSGIGYGYGRSGSGGYNAADHKNTLTDLTSFSNSVRGIKPIAAKSMPNEVSVFRGLFAGAGGGKTKPKLGASASGR